MKTIFGMMMAAFCAVAFTGCGDKGSGGGAKSDPQAAPETALADAISLLEAKQYRKALETYTDPTELKNKKPEDMDKKIKDMESESGQKFAEMMITHLKKFKDIKPKISEDGNTATFEIEKDGNKDSIKMVKVDGKWYMK